MRRVRGSPVVGRRPRAPDLVAVLVVLAAIAAIAGSCAASGGPSAGTPATPEGFGTPEPASPTASPLEAEWATLETLPDGTLVVIVGRVRAGMWVSCFQGLCGIDLVDPLDPDTGIILRVLAVDEAGAPNTMQTLPESFSEDDLRLTADDGTPIGSGDVIRVTAHVRRSEELVALGCVRIETAAEPEPTPGPTPRSVTFRELAGLPEGTVVRIRGELGLPMLTSCGSGTCRIDLDDPKSSRSASLYVPIAATAAERHSAMLELPSSYRAKDLRVFAADGTVLHKGDRAWITGTLANGPDAEWRSIDVTRIDGV